MYLHHINKLAPDAVYKLSMPPSVNEAYANAKSGGRVKSAKYKAWKKIARSELWGQQIKHFNEPVALLHNLYVPDNRVRDCANYEKAATDFLVDVGILQDDSLVRLNMQQWQDWLPKQRGVEIYIFSLASCLEMNNITIGT